MELQDPTLYSILQSLYKNNGRKSWNMHPENSGDIVLKIRFNGHDIGSKQIPNSKVKRNMIRSDKWKQRNHCDPKPAMRNCLDLSPENISESNGIENPRNCDDPCENQMPYSLDHDLSTVDCAPPKTLDQSPLLNCAEPITPPIASQFRDDSDSEPFEECLSRDMEIEKSEIPQPFDPYDNDNDSNFDPEGITDWRRDNADRPCIEPGCFYRPNQTIDPSEVHKQLGERPNGTFGGHYKCDKCGRIMCNDCIYFKMRHLHHFKNIKEIYYDRRTGSLETKPIPVDEIVRGFI